VRVEASRLQHLLTATAIGDQDAFGERDDTAASRSYALALQVTRHVEDTQERVCDVYHPLWRQAERFDAGRGSVLGWFATFTAPEVLYRATKPGHVRERTPKTRCFTRSARRRRQEAIERRPAESLLVGPAGKERGDLGRSSVARVARGKRTDRAV